MKTPEVQPVSTPASTRTGASSPDAADPIVVVGGGVTGLACAHALKRAGLPTLLIEARERVGGVMQSREREGFRFEQGPNTIPASARHFRELCGELGIAERLVTSSEESSLRYLFARGALRPLPSGPLSFLFSPLLGLGAKLRMLSEPLRKLPRRGDECEEPSFEAFLTERIGAEATQTLAGAFVRGVYAAELRQLGARSAFGRLWELANENGGLLRGLFAAGKARKRAGPQPAPPGPQTKRGSLLSFERGLSVLGDSIASELGAQLLVGEPVQALARADGGWRVQLEGRELRASELVLAVPAPAAAALLQGSAPEAALDALRAVEHAQIAVAHLGFDTLSLPPGFGFLLPPNEPRGQATPRALGILFSSNIFPGCAPAGCSSVTCIYDASEHAQRSDTELLAIASEDLRRALKLRDAPRAILESLVRWRDVIPRYGVGHRERMALVTSAMADACPGLHLAGNHQGGVSVEDCIQRGRELGRSLAAARSAGASR